MIPENAVPPWESIPARGIRGGTGVDGHYFYELEALEPYDLVAVFPQTEEQTRYPSTSLAPIFHWG